MLGGTEMELGLGEVVGGAMVGEVEEVSLDEVSAAILFSVTSIGELVQRRDQTSRPPLFNLFSPFTPNGHPHALTYVALPFISEYFFIKKKKRNSPSTKGES